MHKTFHTGKVHSNIVKRVGGTTVVTTVIAFIVTCNALEKKRLEVNAAYLNLT